MLNRLKLENFKAWREADLTFGKVTGFFGTKRSWAARRSPRWHERAVEYLRSQRRSPARPYGQPQGPSVAT